MKGEAPSAETTQTVSKGTGDGASAHGGLELVFAHDGFTATTNRWIVDVEERPGCVWPPLAAALAPMVRRRGNVRVDVLGTSLVIKEGAIGRADEIPMVDIRRITSQSGVIVVYHGREVTLIPLEGRLEPVHADWLAEAIDECRPETADTPDDLRSLQTEGGNSGADGPN